ncbi:MAG TPA: hypothetical protein VF430_07895 [Verrucomicrobiae bacterium]
MKGSRAMKFPARQALKRFRNASAAIVTTSIRPLGIHLFVFARRTAKTTSSIAIIMFASFPRNDESKIPGTAVRIKIAANTADVMSDTLLFALKNPINPPTSSRMI